MLPVILARIGAGAIMRKYSRLACRERAKAGSSLGGRSLTAQRLRNRGDMDGWAMDAPYLTSTTLTATHGKKRSCVTSGDG